jgi:multidrug efflux pump subunit AcrA (membrane-fusion protein)
LLTLRDSDRWWGARLGLWTRRSLAALFGPERPLVKVFSLVIAGLLLYGLFGVKIFRIDATSQLGTDSTRLISATYDGFLNQVNVTSGDSVKQGALLAALDTRELIQQEIETLADMQRFRAEATKARASQNLADAEIAGRRLAQVEARLKRIRFSLAQSRVYAPFDGVVVEGERKDLLGAPVKKGDRLFRLAQIEGLYVVLHVPESEIRYVTRKARGELSLLARPDTRIAFEVETLMPVAQVKGQDGNHFVIKARLLDPPEPWWRPGMSGAARIDAGEHNVAWIYTHKAIDALRMKLWL